MGSICFKPGEQSLMYNNQASFFDLKANDITGKRIDFYIYRNRKAIVVVNVASKSRIARINYKMLNQLYLQFRQQGLLILAFPCNQFDGKQPKNNDEIQAFVTQKYDVKFTMLEKVEVNGINAHAVFRYLRTRSQLYDRKQGKSGQIPSNFSIFLLNKEGKVVRYFEPSKDLSQLKLSIKKLISQSQSEDTIQY